MDKKRFLFTVNPAEATGAADALRSVGVDVSSVLGALGIVVGSADEATVNAAELLPSVHKVEIDGTTKLPGPPQ
jgi:hypothetical protein